MATRRAVGGKGSGGQDEPASRILPATATTIAGSGPSDTTPAVPRRVIIKLLVFTLLMVAGPISMYFLASNWLFWGKNKNIYAGALAAFMANCVLIAYVISSIREEDEDGDADAANKKKPPPPLQKKLE